VTLAEVQNDQAAMAFAASGRIDIPARGIPEALMIRQDLFAGGLYAANRLRGKKIAWVGKYGPSMYYVSTILRKLACRWPMSADSSSILPHKKRRSETRRSTPS
jgi:hypothetical protein